MATLVIEEALSTAQVAAMLGVRKNTVERWRLFGKGPKFVKLGDTKQSGVIYDRSEVQRWMRERTFASTSAYPADSTNSREKIAERIELLDEDQIRHLFLWLCEQLGEEA